MCYTNCKKKNKNVKKTLQLGEKMYKKEIKENNLFDFNEAFGVKLDEENRWIKKSKMIPWEKIEKKYAKLFQSDVGNVAKPLRMALGSLIIQKEKGLSDIELVNEIVENPYLQYFIGLKKWTDKKPFVPSLLVEFRKRLNDDIMIEINEMIINSKREDEDTDGNNNGTLIIDATCAPQNISYPQDTNLLNEARKATENIIDDVCYEYNEVRPRTYRIKAQKEFTDFSKSKRKNQKKIRKEIKKLLQYIRRNVDFINKFETAGKKISIKNKNKLGIVQKVYNQQKEMYQNKTHRCEDRIVSLSEPFVRPIVRGKAKSPVEFGAKLDLSIDNKGNARIEKLSFDAYNESEVLQKAIERFKEIHGYYPERVLADQIYRNNKNIHYCNERNIRISGVALNKQKLNYEIDKKVAKKDNVDRIEVERAFSLLKRKFGLGKIWTKLENTSKSSIILSIIVMNINHIMDVLFCFLELMCNRGGKLIIVNC